jgi:DNA-directed RNA polymerase specialized sigma24 family protein
MTQHPQIDWSELLRYVVRYMRGQTRCRAVAEEVASLVAFSILKNPDPWQGKDVFGADEPLLQIAIRQRHIDYLRKEESVSRLQQFVGFVEGPVDPGPTPLLHLLIKERPSIAARIMALVEANESPGLALVFRLYLDGIDSGEIACRTGWNSTTVRVAVHRLLIRLRERFCGDD